VETEKRVVMFNDPIFRVNPSLAQEIGLLSSILFLQLEYKCSISPYYYNNQYWYKTSLRSLCDEFKGNNFAQREDDSRHITVEQERVAKKKTAKTSLFSKSGIERELDYLEEIGIILKRKLFSSTEKFDTRIYFYSINYDGVAKLQSINVGEVTRDKLRRAKTIQLHGEEVKLNLSQTGTSSDQLVPKRPELVPKLVQLVPKNEKLVPEMGVTCPTAMGQEQQITDSTDITYIQNEEKKPFQIETVKNENQFSVTEYLKSLGALK